MNWGRIKTIFIAVLLIVNLYLGISMLIRHRETTYIDDEVQELTSQIAAKWGLNISKETIPDTRPSGGIYEYSFSAQDYCITAAKRLFGENSNTSTYIFRDGIKVVSESDTQSVYFTSGTGDIFGFEYKSDDESTVEADYVISLKARLPNADFYGGVISYNPEEEATKGTGSSLEQNSSEQNSSNQNSAEQSPAYEQSSDLIFNETENAVLNSEGLQETTAGEYDGTLDFPTLRKLTVLDGSERSGLGKSAADYIMSVICGDSNTDQSAVTLEIYNIIKETDSEYTLVTLGEIADGKKISGCGAICVYRTEDDGNSTLVYANGSLIFAVPEGEYKSALRDQINIIFDERDFIYSASEECNKLPEDGFVSGIIETEAAAETSDSENTAEKPEMKNEIKSMTVMYCVNWNSAMTKYYLIPAWQIEYTDGTVRIRNAINGGLYR